MSVQPDCTVECEAAPTCAVCRRTKPPRGRSVPMEAANGMCSMECSGYWQAPKSGHLWPGELGRASEDS
jgi:hypothetical protein